MSKLKTNRLLELETKPRHNAIYIYLYNIIFFLKIKLNFNGDVMVRIKLHIVRCWIKNMMPFSIMTSKIKISYFRIE